MLEINLTIISPIVALLLLFWFETNFVLEYGKLFRIRKLLAIEKFENAVLYNPRLTYQVFIATNYRGFFHKLLSCSVCLATWISMVCSLIASLICDEYLFLAMIPFNVIIGMMLYLLIKRLL